MIQEFLIEERTLRQLLKTTPRAIKERGDVIDVRLLTTTRRGKYFYRTETLSNGHAHLCSIRPLGKKFLTMNEDVVVSCDCENFKFVDEVALWKTNASEARYSNGALPKITNPAMRKKLCKHLVAVIEDFEERI
jgi:hypothetical protein